MTIVCWVAMILAVILDFWSGIDAAKYTGVKISSKGLRKSGSKLVDYWRLQLMAAVIDIITSCCFCWYTIPYMAILVTIAVVLIEGHSVVENSRIKKSHAADVPAMMKAIIEAATEKDALDILNKFKKILNDEKE